MISFPLICLIVNSEKKVAKCERFIGLKVTHLFQMLDMTMTTVYAVNYNGKGMIESD